MPHLLKSVENYLDTLNTSAIGLSRRSYLQTFADKILSLSDSNGTVSINFICTHNARRSQLSEVWARSIAHYFNIGPIGFSSGGTEITRVHPNIIESLRQAGFVIQADDETKDNPIYAVTYAEMHDPMLIFSKSYDSSFSRQNDYLAVLNCPHAEATCPFLPPPIDKIALSFEDPGKFDETEEANEAYKNSCRTIATEMLWVMKTVAGS